MADVSYDSTLIALRADETVESPMRRALRRLKRRKGALFGLAVIGVFILLAVFAPLIAPFDPAAQSWTSVRKAPSALHWFGTDEVGRDVMTRVIFGTRASLLAGVISVSIALAVVLFILWIIRNYQMLFNFITFKNSADEKLQPEPGKT